MLVLEQIEFKNFLSVGNSGTIVELNKHSASVVTGTNGSGKSIMMDALCFVLYNKSYRKVKKPQLVNSVNKKDCLVTIDFSVGSTKYKVSRGIKPAIFEIYKNGVLLPQDAASKDYQDLLESDILKMSYKTFCQIVLLGTANWTPFMQLTPADRRIVIEDLLDIEIFSTMNSILKERVKKNAAEKTKLEDENKMLQQIVDIGAENKAKSERENSAEIQKFEAAITAKTDELTTVHGQLRLLEKQDSDVCKKIDDLEVEREKYFTIQGVLNTLKKEIPPTEQEITFYRNTRVCATCNQNLDEEFATAKISELEADNVQRAADIEECHTHMALYKDSLDKYTQYNGERDEILTAMDDAEKDITDIERMLQRLEEKKTDLENVPEYVDNGADKAAQRISENSDTLGTLLTDRDRMAVVETLLKDDGIKSRIISQYIPLINKLVNKYLTDMGLFVKFTLDDQFKETILAQHKEVYSYESFSQGEQMRINLAFLFTWREIAKQRNSTACNFLLLDEVMDSSMDETGVDEFLDVIFMLTVENNVYIISHNKSIPDRFDRHLVVSKHNNFTRIEDAETVSG